MLKQQVKELENKLYPSLLDKFLKKLKDLILPETKHDIIELSYRDNQGRVRRQAVDAGFGNITEDFGQFIKNNQKEFSVSISWYVDSNTKISYDLQFEKNKYGLYDFTKYTASLSKWR